MKNVLHLLSTFILLPILAISQGLCDSDEAVEGGFSLAAVVGCSPFKVKPTNLTDWDNVQYVFDYRGQPADELVQLNPRLDDVFFTGPNGESRSPVILQYGIDKNGTQRYSCQQVEVREGSKPIFTYSTCNRNVLNLIIPKNEMNPFDNYTIYLGNGESFMINQLPLDTTYNYAAYAERRTIRVEGSFKNSAACDMSTSVEVSMLDGGSYPNIDTLELNKGKDTLSLSFQGFSLGHKLYQREISSSYNVESPEKLISKGDENITGLNNETQYCFSTYRNTGGCVEVSGEVCTIPLELKPLSSTTIQLSWLEHPFTDNLLHKTNGSVEEVTYNLIKTENGEQNIVSNITSPYIENIDCVKEYNYKIEAVVKGLPKFGAAIPYESRSISNLVSYSPKTTSPSKITDIQISYSPYSDDKVLSFTDNSNWAIKKDLYYVHVGTTVLPIDSVKTDIDSISIKGSNECFSLSYKDKCGSKSELSPEVCLVQLESPDKVNLKWTKNNPFSNEDIKTYEIYAYEESMEMLTFIDEKQNNLYLYNPDLSNYTNKALFKVKVLGANGSESFTNSVALPLSFNLYIPDVISPNGNIENQALTLKGNLTQASEIKVKVLDRLGFTVFQSTDKNMVWKPKKNLPTGSYVYMITAKLLDGSVFKKKGRIILIR